MTGNKKKSLALILCISSFSVFLFIVSDYVSAEAPSNKTQNIDVVKIPPPIEGIIMPAERKAQNNLKKVDIAIKTANGNIYKYNVELAITPEEQRIGMMFREHIKENTGMLFSFTKAAERNFWMKDTYIPLDILFIRKDGIITHIHHMAKENSTKRIKSNGNAIAVLEIAGGEAEILGINIGDRILYKDFEPDKLK